MMDTTDPQALLRAFLAHLGLLLDGDGEIEQERWSDKTRTWDEYVDELTTGLGMREKPIEIWRQDTDEFTILLLGKEITGVCYTRIIVLKKTLPQGILLIPNNDTVNLFPNFPLDNEEIRRIGIDRVVTMTELDCHGARPTQRLRIMNPHFAERNITITPIVGGPQK